MNIGIDIDGVILDSEKVFRTVADLYNTKNEKENKNSKRYLPHDLKTKENAVKTYLNNNGMI